MCEDCASLADAEVGRYREALQKIASMPSREPHISRRGDRNYRLGSYVEAVELAAHALDEDLNP